MNSRAWKQFFRLHGGSAWTMKKAAPGLMEIGQAVFLVDDKVTINRDFGVHIGFVLETSNGDEVKVLIKSGEPSKFPLKKYAAKMAKLKQMIFGKTESEKADG